MIIIDSSIFCAYFNSNDIFHVKSTKLVNELMQGKHGPPIITDYIFDEVISIIQRKCSKQKALETGEYLLNSSIILVNIEDFRKAWIVFKKTELFSFTDCTIISTLESLNIKKLATYDKAFNNVNNIDV